MHRSLTGRALFDLTLSGQKTQAEELRIDEVRAHHRRLMRAEMAFPLAIVVIAVALPALRVFGDDPNCPKGYTAVEYWDEGQYFETTRALLCRRGESRVFVPVP